MTPGVAAEGEAAEAEAAEVFDCVQTEAQGEVHLFDSKYSSEGKKILYIAKKCFSQVAMQKTVHRLQGQKVTCYFDDLGQVFTPLRYRNNYKELQSLEEEKLETNIYCILKNKLFFQIHVWS